MNAPDDRDEDITPAEVTECSRVLGAMTPATRRMVRRLVKVLSLALAHRPARRPRLAPIEPIEPDDGPADDVTRAHARRLLSRHGRGTGGAA